MVSLVREILLKVVLLVSEQKDLLSCTINLLYFAEPYIWFRTSKKQ